MKLTNVALTTTFATLLIASSVEFASYEHAASLFALLIPPKMLGEFLQQVGDLFALLNGMEQVGQGGFSVSLERKSRIANSPDGQRFREAVSKGNMINAWIICHHGKDELKEYCDKYLVGLGSFKLIELIGDSYEDEDDDDVEHWDERVRKWLLHAILEHANQRLIGEVFGAINVSNGFLKEALKKANLACNPPIFTLVLSKIGNKNDQVGAVRNGVNALFDANKPNALIPFSLLLGREHF